ncbi:MAG: sigma-54-dependent Fis family transcriptional regulator [Spirochaetaceae bacterium]|nr:sigma-54-dependent Fis family transcriptional regulator [Myxococcales bacterium]MCB9722764.1 sigma-54-dependent Fis family transcriptional regulator [Spirochaetaceae bacterium]
MADSILIAEDERASAEYLKLLLEERGFEVRVAGNGVEALLALEARPVDLVITDLRMPSMDGFELLSHLAQRWPNLPAIVLSGNDGVEDILEAVRLGAVNYLLKPATPAAVVSAVERALLTRERSVVADATVPELVGTSKAMVEVRHRVLMAARSDVHVLVTGDTGTGKELVSRAIHTHSGLAKGPFVAHNCALSPPDLFESEFFGHRRGSFTGADRDRRGLLREAHQGVLFLDELETLDPVFQAKLLRVIDDGEVRPVGAERPERVDVRFVAATNREAQTMIEEGSLREDLYYRLRGIEIRLPPLASRREDIPLLVRHFDRADSPGFTPEALEALARAPLPGNVRQLRNLVQGARAAAGDTPIGLRHLPDDQLGSRQASVPSGMGSEGVPRGLSLRELERRAIAQALDDCDGNRTHAAKLLDIDRSTLRRKIQEYGL